MKIRLKDSNRQKDVLIDAEVDYSFRPDDLTAIFINEDEECMLTNGKYSVPYNQYTFKKVQNIICISFQYERHNYTLTLGEYLEASHLYHFIIKEDNDAQDNTFVDLDPYNEIRYSSFKLCDYKEYQNVCELTCVNPLSRIEFYSDILFGKIEGNDYSLYTDDKKQKSLRYFMNKAEMSNFLDREELRTTV